MILLGELIPSRTLLFFKGSLIHSKKNCLVVRMKDLRTLIQWYLINVHAPNARFPRDHLWSSLCCLIGNQKNDLWMVAGDFNYPLYPSEKPSGCEDYSESITELADFISYFDLMDINLSDSKFTWSNRRLGKNLIQVRLDRLLVFTNSENFDSFSLCSFPRSGSNDNTILLVMDDPCDHKHYPFRYEMMWSHHPDFRMLLEQWWNVQVLGTPMYQIAQKLKLIKDKVKGWNR